MDENTSPWSGDKETNRDLSLDPPRIELWKEIRKDNELIKVYWVDGFYIRNNIDLGFVDGGHGYEYTYIPKDEVWIENNDDGDDRDEQCDLTHELTERDLMKNGHDGRVGYEEGHGFAQYSEKELRNKWIDPDYKGPVGDK